ncbi:MAG: hypothetical protein B7Z06_06415 [Flavobacteriales bacterium 32-35-8]|nr:MAG: hypothetical protein B7Z06_06415 [Flavobacteriales bacterium 32-35-8]
MKNSLFILTFIILVDCGSQPNVKSNSIIGMEFQDFKQVNQLENYIKISDTVIYENGTFPKYGILHLRDKTNNLVVFKSLSMESNQDIRFKILDTLIIPNPNTSELVTIGYCQENEDNNENLIALVDKTDSLMIQNIKKVWRANTTSQKIESITSLKKINCLNEERPI